MAHLVNYPHPRAQQIFSYVEAPDAAAAIKEAMAGGESEAKDESARRGVRQRLKIVPK
jgi:hypothetical protein